MSRAAVTIAKPTTTYQEPAFDNELEPFTDTGNGSRLAINHCQHLRYVPQWGWMVFDNGVWRKDVDNMRATEAAKHTLRSMASEHLGVGSKYEQDQWHRHIRYSFNHIPQMVNNARTVYEIASKVTDFDADPWLLNCANGVLNMRSGQLEPHSAAHLFTKQSPVEYTPHATAPTWEKFLDEVFQGDRELIRWVQKALGYSMTASVKEQVWFLCYGSGRNGKSTLLEAVDYVLGTYANAIKIEALMDNPYKGNGADPELSSKVGIRYLHSVEPNERREKAAMFASGTIKKLTGGDGVEVRELNKMPFTLHPQFKLWVAVNNRPESPESTVAWWERIRLIPFNARFTGVRCDKDLPDKLKAEAPGILNWLMEGCLLWQADGLGDVPAAVKEATSAYQEREDEYAAFFEGVLVLTESRTDYVPLKDAHQAFVEWKTQSGASWLSDRALANIAEKHGFTRGRIPHKNIAALYGGRLVSEDERAAKERAESGGDGGDNSHFCIKSLTRNDIQKEMQNGHLPPPPPPISTQTLTVTLDPPGAVEEQPVLPRRVPVLTPAPLLARAALTRLQANRAEWLVLGATDAERDAAVERREQDARQQALAAEDKARQQAAEANWQAECATADPATWWGAWHLLPLCPNHQHLHGHLGYCPTSKLPIGNADALPHTAISFQYDHAGTVIGAELPGGVEQKHFPHLLHAAAFAARTQGRPISAELQAKVDDLQTKLAQEHAKLACPHPTVETIRMRRSIKPICQACGAEVYPDGTVL